MFSKRQSRIYLLILFTMSMMNFTGSANEANHRDSMYPLSKINSNIKEIEKIFQSENLEQVCEIANSSSYLIKENMKELKSVEPNHNWIEIRLLLQEIANAYCK